jgi:hypothetical protein
MDRHLFDQVPEAEVAAFPEKPQLSELEASEVAVLAFEQPADVVGIVHLE